MFYDIYCDLCQSHGLTPSGAAGKIGFNRASVTMWKNTGKAPKQELLLRIAEYFQVSVDYLLEKEKADTPQDARDILDEVDVAFYGDFLQLSEDDKQTLRDMARIMRERRKNSFRKEYAFRDS